MRTAELLNALAQAEPGIACLMSPDRAIVTTLYQPALRGDGKTPFEAAFQLAQEIHIHPHCPPEVSKALDEYDFRTNCLRL